MGCTACASRLHADCPCTRSIVLCCALDGVLPHTTVCTDHCGLLKWISPCNAVQISR